MNPTPPDDLSHLSMLEIFRVESENQIAVLTSGLLELERLSVADPSPQSKVQSPKSGDAEGRALPLGQAALDLGQATLDSLMRAAHSLKGAARIVGLESAVRIAHAMEDCCVAAQSRPGGTLGRTEVDLLFRGVDLLQHIATVSRHGGTGGRDDPAGRDWAAAHQAEIAGFLDGAASLLEGLGKTTLPKDEGGRMKDEGAPVSSFDLQPSTFSGPPSSFPPPERVLRLTAENLNRLLGLAGESLIVSRWLRPFSENMQRLKRYHFEVGDRFNQLRAALEGHELPEGATEHLRDIVDRLADCRAFMNGRLDELDQFDRRSAQLSHRLYLEVLRTRMRPFSDCLPLGGTGFPRMVRDLARSLGKEVRLEIVGENTQVDRDILEKLEMPLGHLLRNAVDHGCEPPDVRRKLGKPPAATIRLEARHSAGMLLVVVSDDGAGVNPDHLREAIVRKRLTLPALAQKMSEAELLEFLFLPGFTMKDHVTEISGRGVGLDVVQNMVKTVRGSLRVSSQPGRGTRFQLQLPLTLSVLRTLLVEIDGEPYAIPLGQISRTLQLSRERIEALEGRHHFQLDHESVGLLAAHQILGCGSLPSEETPNLPVVVLGERSARYGVVVDRFLGERELVVQPLDPRLGKVKDVSAAALMEDGTPVLIVDVEDLLRSVEKLIAEGGVFRVGREPPAGPARRRKRVLAVDDSLTVRELQRKLLTSGGYEAEVAVDGLDGWNTVRAGHFDLVITDVDMPRLDGIELTRLIKNDPRLNSLPVLIVSYKDRDEDRLRGLEAGADYYLTKSSFHDEQLLRAVADLIGEAGA